MELTQENKIKFYSLYMGQKILTTSLKGTILDGNWIERINDDRCDAPIKLKSLYNISEDVAIGVVKILKNKYNIVSIGMKLPIDYCINNIDKTIFYISEVVDYLRYNGYAMPWMGLSIDDMILAGWIIID